MEPEFATTICVSWLMSFSPIGVLPTVTVAIGEGSWLACRSAALKTSSLLLPCAVTHIPAVR
jgi:hypothetical protein